MQQMYTVTLTNGEQISDSAESQLDAWKAAWASFGFTGVAQVDLAEPEHPDADESHTIGYDVWTMRVDCIECGLEPDDERISEPCSGEPRGAGL